METILQKLMQVSIRLKLTRQEISVHFQIGASSGSPLSDAFVHYDGKLLGFCVDDEVVYTTLAQQNAPGPKYNVVPINQIGASLERMGMTEMLGH